jgi:hypothetical protein
MVGFSYLNEIFKFLDEIFATKNKPQSKTVWMKK